jgi:fatty acid desaturase
MDEEKQVIRRQSKRAIILRLVKRLLVAQLVILLLVAVLYYLWSAGDWSWSGFGTALLFPGAILIISGFTLLFGGLGPATGPLQHYAEAAGAEDTSGRRDRSNRQQGRGRSRRAYPTASELLILGLTTFASGLLIDVLAM